MRYFDTSEVNKELVRTILGDIQTDPSIFDGREFGIKASQPLRECRKPCCLAGLAIICSFDSEVYPEYDDISEIAQEFLNLSNHLAAILFDAVWPAEWLGENRTPNAGDASRILRLIEDDVLPYAPITHQQSHLLKKESL